MITTPVIDLKPKQKKTIDIWKNMTVSEVASATGIPVGKLYLLMKNYTILYICIYTCINRGVDGILFIFLSSFFDRNQNTTAALIK